jgi:hypothetical protein
MPIFAHNAAVRILCRSLAPKTSDSTISKALENIKQKFMVEWMGSERRRAYIILMLIKWGLTNRMECKWKPL